MDSAQPDLLPRIDLDEAQVAQQVFAARVQVFNSRVVAGAFTSPLGTALLAWTQVNVAGLRMCVLWFCMINAVELLTVGLGFAYRRSPTRDQYAARWAWVQIACGALIGLAWGSSVWFFWVEGQFLHYLMDLAIVVAVSAISILIMAPFRSAAVLFSVGIVTPPLLQLGVVDNPLRTEIAVGLVVLVLVQLQFARDVGKELFVALDNAVRNANLVDLLTQARSALAQTNRDVEAKNEKLQAALVRLNEMVTHDELTGAHNRRFIFEQLDGQWATKARYGTAVSLLMFDLDHFKTINDRFGHPVGDQALRLVVRAVSAQLREGDLLARVGGEEFFVLLPQTSQDAAAVLAERLRVAVAQTVLEAAGEPVRLRASFGVAELVPGDTVSAWVQRADAALYQAKAQGRDRVSLAG